jgi:hypothetical protein
MRILELSKAQLSPSMLAALMIGHHFSISERQALAAFADRAVGHPQRLTARGRPCAQKWALLYIERWLTASMEKDGELIERTRGTPQGGVISPILANLFRASYV